MPSRYRRLQGVSKTRYGERAGKKTNKRLSHKLIRRILKKEATRNA